MIKKLFFMAALLAPGLAYAGTPSATLPGQIVPAGSPPAVPAPATAAGFTTCIICSDFTATSGGIYYNGAAVAGANASQPNTWLDCAGATSPVWFQDGNQMDNLSNPPPCPNIISDGGTQVLQQVFRQQDWPNYTNQINQGNQLTTYASHRGGAGYTVPAFIYFEATYRSPNFPAYPGGYSEGLFVGGYGAAPNNNKLEFDGYEVNGSGNVSAGMGAFSHNWNCSPTCDDNLWNGTFPPTFSGGINMSSTYHKVAMRITGDGTTAIVWCVWIDDQLQGCKHYPQGSLGMTAWQLAGYGADSPQNARAGVEAYFSAAGLWGNNSGTNLPAPMTGNIKSINIWSCSNWQTTPCLSSTSDPGNY